MSNKKVKAPEVVSEKVKAPELKEVYKIKSEKSLGFTKRNYFIGDKKVLLEAGKEYSKSEYDEFSAEAKAVFFE